MSKKIIVLLSIVLTAVIAILILQLQKYSTLAKKSLELKRNTRTNVSIDISPTRMMCTPPTAFPTSPESNEFESLSWEHFTNETLGISFEYPRTVKDIESNWYLKFDSINQRIRLPSHMSYSFEVEKIVTNDSVEKWLKKNLASGSTYMSKTKFMNRDAYYVETIYQQQVPSDFYIVPRVGSLLLISFEKPPRMQDTLTGRIDCETLIRDALAERKYFKYNDLVMKRILSSIEFTN